MLDLFDLTGRVAVVTGGNGGIGLGIARGLAQAGASPVLVGRNTAKSEAAVKSIVDETGAACYAVAADVAKEADVARAVAEILGRSGAIHVLVNNAGTSIRKPPHEVSLDEWHAVLDANLTSAFLVSKAVYPSMKASGGGKVINIGSLATVLGTSYAPAYAASKGGLMQLTRSQALAWAPDNIQVQHAIHPWLDRHRA